MSGSTIQVEAVLPSTLAEELADRIRLAGKITFRDWMEAALYHPNLGYYNRADLRRWGKHGDYRTSPERSELFAATFARYFVTLYARMGRPVEFTIVEVGAGNGQFAASLLDALENGFPSVFRATTYVIDEASEDARQRAAEELGRFAGRVQFARLRELAPVRSGIIFSNELLDAFPVHRVTVVKGQLKEFFVTLKTSVEFDWVLEEPSSVRLRKFCQEHLPVLTEGQIVDVNLGVADWFRTVDDKLSSGYLITVDYGSESDDLYGLPERHLGTLRAFRRHEFVDDVLNAPGDYDITSTVDWTYVKAEGQRCGFEVEEFAQLDTFLIRAGVLDELESRLARASSEAEKSILTTAAREMILPLGMGSTFQVLVQKRYHHES